MPKKQLFQDRFLSIYSNQKTKKENNKIINLTCPSCKEQEAYMFLDGWHSICPRLNNCGAKTSIWELFPDLQKTQNFIPKHQSKYTTLDDCQDYLLSRNISNEVISKISGQFYPLSNDIREGGGIVFKFANGGENGKPFLKSTEAWSKSGTCKLSEDYFKINDFLYDTSKPLFITESVIDALSLIQLGQQAIAFFNVNCKLNKVQELGFSNIVLALDNDKAGIDSIKRLKLHNKTLKACLPYGYKDWNEALQVIETIDNFKNKLPSWYSYAERITCNTPQEYFDFTKDENKKYFTFHNKTYFISTRKIDKDIEEKYFVEAMDGVLEPFYWIKEHESGLSKLAVIAKSREGNKSLFFDDTKAKGDVAKFAGYLFQHQIDFTLKGTQAQDLRQALISDLKQSDTAYQTKHAGYFKPLDAYVFNNWLINGTGEVILGQTKEDVKFIKHHNTAVLPSKYKCITPNLDDTKEKAKNIIHTLYASFGHNGLTCLSFMVASWFLRLIKDNQKGIGCFPYISALSSKGGTGKTSLARFLNSLQCIDEELINITSSSTKAGIVEGIKRHNNLVSFLDESNADGIKENSIIANMIKPYYSSPSLYNRSKQDETSYEYGRVYQDLNAYSGLIWLHNSKPAKDHAEKTRFIPLIFNARDFKDTKDIFNRLISIPMEDRTSIFIEVMKNRKFFEDNFIAQIKSEATKLTELGVKDYRIALNHSIVITSLKLLLTVLGLPEMKEFSQFILTTAKGLIEELGEDAPIAVEFLEQLQLFRILANAQASVETKKFGDFTNIEILATFFQEKYISRDGINKDCYCIDLKRALEYLKRVNPKYQPKFDDVRNALKEHSAWVNLTVPNVTTYISQPLGYSARPRSIVLLKDKAKELTMWEGSKYIKNTEEISVEDIF
jgi:hypothetical protein